MKFLDLTLPSPAENLACDEALLDRGETGGGELLRFWEPREHFVVVGYANRVKTEVNVPACATSQIPIFRRCSGGGTVLQGPGCLNYTLVLQIGSRPQLANISRANKFIMERNCQAVQSAVGHPQPTISVRGYTDLALDTRSATLGNPRKFSGNSQRRHKHALLFHGTFLLHFDLRLVNEFLRMPSQPPDYRKNRGHDEFLTNLNLPAARLKRALQAAWDASGETHDFPEAQTHRLSGEKYATRNWNFKS